uniref:Peptidase M3A/M3B catalytic domain-containing protein n=1 Tax=Rhizochromulina marina TaxID=1034831 RepID=A0A7S2RIB0_9STRA
MITVRHELSTRLGFESFAHRTLFDKMERDPQRIVDFLLSTAEQLQPLAEEELRELQEAKQKMEPSPATQGASLPDIHQWDLPFYSAVVKSQKQLVDPSAAAPYLPLDQCIQGLRVLCEQLFGLETSLAPASPGESWASAGSILKLQLSHASHGPLGTIFLDLHPRQQKYFHSAHFTVRCGCKVPEVMDPDFPTECHHNGHQLPVVALVMSLGHRPNDSSMEHLSLQELETLFHEFGHALHSLLSRTTFQHLAGTRTAADFVETPSQLLEMFAWNHDVLSTFARHPLTGTVLPTDLLEGMQKNRRQHSALDSLQQVLLSLVDQRAFSRDAAETMRMPSVEAREYLSSLTKEVHEQVMPTAMPYAEGTNWLARFGHLTTYGATYYGYLYDKAFATQLWHELFASQPLNRHAGERLWKNLLLPGGSADPYALLRNTMNGTEADASALAAFMIAEKRSSSVSSPPPLRR